MLRMVTSNRQRRNAYHHSWVRLGATQIVRCYTVCPSHRPEVILFPPTFPVESMVELGNSGRFLGANIFHGGSCRLWSIPLRAQYFVLTYVICNIFKIYRLIDLTHTRSAFHAQADFSEIFPEHGIGQKDCFIHDSF